MYVCMYGLPDRVLTCLTECPLHSKMVGKQETSSSTTRALPTKAQKFHWDDEAEEKLVGLHEARPCLWDTAGPTHIPTEM
mmetsp:Transcript_6227/g.9477  ORF Transcript_6227/g.9477 Transcript_6227/m.9477 type:complete len:80 (-) Transcript_6227:631-870(-)